MAEKEAESLHGAPVTTPVTRLDEVGAARHPVFFFRSARLITNSCIHTSSVSVEGEDRLSFVKARHSIGEVKSFYGNFLVVVRALTYLMTLGKEGIPEASQNAVQNANNMMNKLKDLYTMAYDEVCMHEFVMSLADLKKKTGVSAMDIAKGLLDNGIHPPTMYFPLIVDEALMVEPTETESKETLDEAVAVFRNLYEMAEKEAESLHGAPVTTPVTRLDEVGAARHPVLRYEFS